MIARDSNPATAPRMIQQSDALSVAPFRPPKTKINIAFRMIRNALLEVTLLIQN